MLKKYGSLLLISTLLLTGCSSNQNNNTSQETEVKTTMTQDEKEFMEVENYSINGETSLELHIGLTETEFKTILKKTNDVKDNWLDKYKELDTITFDLQITDNEYYDRVKVNIREGYITEIEKEKDYPIEEGMKIYGELGVTYGIKYGTPTYNVNDNMERMSEWEVVGSSYLIHATAQNGTFELSDTIVVGEYSYLNQFNPLK